METIEERAEKYYQSLARPLADEKGLVITAYCVGAETERLLKHGVMQAEGSDVSEGAAVGNSAAGQNVSGRHIHYHVHAGSMQKCILCGEINDLDCG